MRLQFGRYRGSRVQDVPNGYVAYLLTIADEIGGDFRAAIALEALERFPFLFDYVEPEECVMCEDHMADARRAHEALAALKEQG